MSLTHAIAEGKGSNSKKRWLGLGLGLGLGLLVIGVVMGVLLVLKHFQVLFIPKGKSDEWYASRIGC